MQRFISLMTLLIMVVFGSAGTALSETSESLTIAIPVGEYTIDAIASGDIAIVEDFGYLLIPGKPKLPSRIFPVALPPGAEVISVTFDIGEAIELPGTYTVPPSPVFCSWMFNSIVSVGLASPSPLPILFPSESSSIVIS